MTHQFLQTDIEEIAARLGSRADGFAGKTVLLTGGLGFLGRYFMEVFSHLNETVLDQPCRLVVLDNLITAGKLGAVFPEKPDIGVVNHNVIEPYSWDGELDFVIHATGIASPFYYRAYPLETLEVAARGTRNMLELAHGHRGV